MDRALDYAKKLSKMIQAETISQAGVPNTEKFDRFHDVLKKLFPLVFEKCEVEYIDSSLLIRYRGKSDKRPILFMSHQDTVEASGGWKHPPFSGEIVGREIWGRGTVDTKGSLFAIFQALEETIREGFIPETDVYIASSSTEEVAGDGAPKTATRLKERGVRLQFLMDEGGMILYEPMKGVKAKFAMIGTLEKGTGNIKFIARSEGGHASAPPKKTPLVRLGRFMAEIEDKDPNKGKMSPTVIEMFRRFAPYTKGSLKFVFKHAKALTPLLNRMLPKINVVGGAMIKTTMAFTMAGGSKGYNVLPSEAWVIANVRFIQHQGIDATLKLLEPIAKKYDIEMELISGKEPQKAVDFNSDAFHLIEETVKEFFPGAIPTPYAMTGGTDAYYYSDVTDNAIRFAPFEITDEQYHSVHAKDENINIDTLPLGVDFYKAIIRKAKA